MIKETHHVKRTSEEVFEFIASNLSWSALFGSKTAECQSMVPWFLSAAPTHPSRMVLLGTLTVTQPIKKISHISKTPNVQYHVHSSPTLKLFTSKTSNQTHPPNGISINCAIMTELYLLRFT